MGPSAARKGETFRYAVYDAMIKHGLFLGAGFSPCFSYRRRSLILLLISQLLLLFAHSFAFAGTTLRRRMLES